MNPSTKYYRDSFSFFDAPEISFPGFVTFQYPGDRQFYFRFNDRNGKPVLFSEGYETAMNCELGIQSVLKNVSKRDRYKTGGESGNEFIILTAGNHLEIARTRSFKDKFEINRAIKWMMTNVHEGEVLFALFEKEEKDVEKKQPVINSYPRNENAPKFTFRIELYPRDEEPLAGVIIDVLKQSKQNFKGLDTKVISKFILDSLIDPFAINADLKIEENDEFFDDLPEEEEALKIEIPLNDELAIDVKTEPLSSDVPIQNSPSVKVKEILSPSLSLPVENLKVEIVGKKKGQLLHNLETDTSFSVRLKIKEVKPDYNNVKLNVKVYSMENPNFSIRMDKEVRFSADGIGLINFFPELTEPGIYRILVNSTDLKNADILSGMTSINVFQVYEIAS